MYCIVACHTTIHLQWGMTSAGGWKQAIANTVIQGGQFGVALFFMVTGYFMCRKGFSLVRLARLWVKVELFSIVCLVLFLILRAHGYYADLASLLQGFELIATLQKELLPIGAYTYWFISIYFMLLILAPFLNRALEQLGERRTKIALVCLVFFTSMFLVRAQLLSQTQLIKAIVCYVIGASFGLYPRTVSWMTPAKTLLIVVFSFLGLCCFNYVAVQDTPLMNFLGWKAYYHDGPWMLWLTAATSLFALTVHAHEPSVSQGGRAGLIAISSSTVGVYLLHENYLGVRMLWRVINHMLDVPHRFLLQLMGVVVVSLVLFTACSIVAIGLETVLVRPITRRLHGFFSWLDVWQQAHLSARV